MLKRMIFLSTILFALASSISLAQNTKKNFLNYSRIYGMALNQDIPKILKVLDTTTVLSETDKLFKTKFENRFKYESDRTNYFAKKDSILNPLLRLYQDYWRKSLLNSNSSNDEYLTGRVITFLKSENQASKFTALDIDMNTLGEVWKNYIESKGYHGVNGKTGSLFDFLVWKTEVDTTYKFKLIDDSVDVKVRFMDEFISKGWEEYATLGRYYPGGWSSSSLLSCVRKAYNLNSESFLVSYLQHEGEHYSDLRRFPNLSSADLEYRAKLIELCYLNKDIFDVLQSFINSSKYDKNNAHPFANYCVIRDVSRVLFSNDFESDLNKWKTIPVADINNAAKKIFLQNTRGLKEKGKDVHSFIE
jgi:hypothetical protein